MSNLLYPIIEPIAAGVAEIAGWVSKASNYLGGGFISSLVTVSTLTALIYSGWNLVSRSVGYAAQKMGTAMASMGKKHGGFLQHLFGGGKQATSAVTAGSSNFLKSFEGFMKAANPKTMLAGGAAMILVASAMWVLAKALQEFSTGVSWEGLAMAGIAIVGLTATMAILAKLSPLVIIGAGAFFVMAGAVWVLGDAMQKMASSAGGFDQIMKTLMSTDASHVLALASSFALLAPAMMGFAVAAAALGTVGAVFGLDTTQKRDKLDTVIEKLDTINDTLTKLDLSVELDGSKVNKGLARVSRYGVT